MNLLFKYKSIKILTTTLLKDQNIWIEKKQQQPSYALGILFKKINLFYNSL